MKVSNASNKQTQAHRVFRSRHCRELCSSFVSWNGESCLSQTRSISRFQACYPCQTSNNDIKHSHLPSSPALQSVTESESIVDPDQVM